jgi:hypothetical protein
MLDMAIDTGRKVGLSQAAITARQKMTTDAMMKLMGGQCINIAVVIERYADFCGQLHRDADPRLQELSAGQSCTRKYRCGLWTTDCMMLACPTMRLPKTNAPSATIGLRRFDR